MSDLVGWRCRRGLLELDLWLGGFWHAHRATLATDEVTALEGLLLLSDMEIMDRLQGRLPVEERNLGALIERLQQFRTASLLEAQ